MDLGLDGRVAAVTGGTRGIGLAIADLLAAEGCHVAVCARSQASLAAVAGRGWLTVEADLTREPDAQRFTDSILSQWGRLDILVNNVGGSLGGGSFSQSTIDQWRAVLDVNIMSMLY